MIEVPGGVSIEECAALALYAHGHKVLEMGSLFGKSTIWMAKQAREVDAVDWHQGDAHAHNSGDTLAPFMANLRAHEITNVRVHVMRFEDIPRVLAGRYGFVFVDGQHDKASVLRDARIALSQAVKGSWLAFHDYVALDEFGVIEALHEVFRRRPEYTVGTVAFYKK